MKEGGIRICGVAVSAYFLSGIAVKKIVGCGVLKSYGVRDFIFQDVVLRGKRSKMAVLRR